MLDEELVVDVGRIQSRMFTVPSTGPVKVTVKGKQDSEKGFDVWVLSTSDLALLRSGEPFMTLSSFSSKKTRSLTNTDTISSGEWHVAIGNSQNLFDSITVSVQVILDPP